MAHPPKTRKPRKPRIQPFLPRTDEWLEEQLPVSEPTSLPLIRPTIPCVFDIGSNDIRGSFSQLHYATVYDEHGYPQLRREFVDYLEDCLDRERGDKLEQSFTNKWLLHVARSYLRDNHSFLYDLYAERTFHYKTFIELSEQFRKKEIHIGRYLINARKRVLEKYLEEEAKLNAMRPTVPLSVAV